MKRLVALDVGTTSIRAAAWSWSGELLVQVVQPAPLLTRAGDRVEQDVHALVERVETMLQTVLQGESAAIALTAQRGTTVLTDSVGAPLTPLISWQDRREGGPLAGLTGGISNVMAHSIASLLVFRWTGCAAENGATASAMRGVARPERIEADVCLPTIGDLPAGSVVVAVGGDKNCELFGAGATAPGRGAVSLGTALSFGTLIACDSPVVPGTFRTPSGVAGLDTVEVGLPAGGSVRSSLATWFRADVDVLSRPSLQDPICVPYFGGSLLDLRATGAFVGLMSASKPEVFASAWLESLALELAYSTHRLPEMDGAIALCGGGAASTVFGTWLAGALGREVRVLAGQQCGLIGAAVLGSRAVSRELSLVPKVSEICLPTDESHWSGRRTAYSQAVQSLTGLDLGVDLEPVTMARPVPPATS